MKTIIKVICIGHNYEYEIREMIKMFFDPSTIEIIFLTLETYDNYKEKNLSQEIILISQLEIENNKAIAISTIDKEVETMEIELNNKEDQIRRLTKRIIKRSLFKILKKTTKAKVPWGVLTGIRPTKIVHKLLEEALTQEEILSILIDEYYIDYEKAVLLLDVANRGHKFVYPIDERKISLYISIPFCPSRCLYCSFPSNSLKQSAHLVDKYVNALSREIEGLGKLIKDTGKKVQTIYIGGGTPTTLSICQFARIFDTIKCNINLDYIEEFTVEAGRPDTIDYEKLIFLKKENVNRISINPQTMNNNTLKIIGRGHTVEEVVESYKMAVEVGFENINMDIIIGLPGEDRSHLSYTMEELKKLSPNNLTVHTLAVKSRSRLEETLENYSLSDQEQVRDMLKITQDYANKMALKPYYMYRQKHMLANLENIGYAKPGHECIYNIQIIEEKQTIIALGAGGVSKFTFPRENKLERVANVKNLEHYIERVDEMIDRKAKFIGKQL